MKSRSVIKSHKIDLFLREILVADAASESEEFLAFPRYRRGALKPGFDAGVSDQM